MCLVWVDRSGGAVRRNRHCVDTQNQGVCVQAAEVVDGVGGSAFAAQRILLEPHTGDRHKPHPSSPAQPYAKTQCPCVRVVSIRQSGAAGRIHLDFREDQRPSQT